MTSPFIPENFSKINFLKIFLRGTPLKNFESQNLGKS